MTRLPDLDPPAPRDPARPNRSDLITERKSHLRSLAVAGALASVGAFAGLAASTDKPATTPNRSGDTLRQQQSVDGTQTDPQAGQTQGFDDPQGDFFDPNAQQGGTGQSAIGPPQGQLGGSQGGPSMSGSS